MVIGLTTLIFNNLTLFCCKNMSHKRCLNSCPTGISTAFTILSLVVVVVVMFGDRLGSKGNQASTTA